MELRTVDPRALRTNPANPRRTFASPEADAILAASIAAIGIIQPPLVPTDRDELVIVAGHRRVAAAIATDLAEIQVLVTEAADGSDDMRALSENIVRAAFNPVDQWRAVESSRQELDRGRHRDSARAAGSHRAEAAPARPHPSQDAGYDGGGRHAARGTPAHYRVGAARGAGFCLEEAQAAQRQRRRLARTRPRAFQAPHDGEGSPLWRRPRQGLRHRRFGDDLAKAYGIVWQEDLFAPADEDGRYTTDVEAFFGAQMEWLRENLPPKAIVLETDAYGRGAAPQRRRAHLVG